MEEMAVRSGQMATPEEPSEFTLFLFFFLSLSLPLSPCPIQLSHLLLPLDIVPYMAIGLCV